MAIKTSQIVFWEDLISSRNFLLSNRINDDVKARTNSLLENTRCISIAEIKNIFDKCIPEVLDDIANSNNLQAALLLNLLHNLPLDEGQAAEWNVCYFLSFELPSFLERQGADCKRSQIILFICGQLGSFIENRANQKIEPPPG